MQTKNLTIEEMGDSGKGLARIAVLSAVDSDGDTYAKGAFSWKQGGDQWAPILVAHNRAMIPLGKARIYEDGDAALAELHLNLETQAGKDWHSALKFDLANGHPVQEWSYGYEVKDSGMKLQSGERVREIKQTDVHEVSAVVRGAGVGTRTLAIKSAELKEQHYAPLIAALNDLASSFPAGTECLSATGLKQLEEIEGAIGAVLKPIRDLAAKEKTTVENAIAGFVRLQSRRHLRD